MILRDSQSAASRSKDLKEAKNFIEYLETTNLGLEHMLKSRIAVCFLARDIEPNFPNLKGFLAFLAAGSKSLDIVCYENDSQDNSAKLLQTLPRTTVISEKPQKKHWGSVRDYGRLKDMAEYRNKYLGPLHSKLHKYDYVMIIDSDMSMYSRPGVMSSFGHLKLKPYIDGIFANGLEWKDEIKDFIFYDTFPLIVDGKVKDQRTFEIMIDTNLWKVQSAFGGIGIYRASSIKHCYYYPRFIPRSDGASPFQSEHTGFHECMEQQGHTELYVNKVMIAVR